MFTINFRTRQIKKKIFNSILCLLYIRCTILSEEFVLRILLLFMLKSIFLFNGFRIIQTSNPLRDFRDTVYCIVALPKVYIYIGNIIVGIYLKNII